jgi:NTP pyrophosphatase (non-canonical NTP hydrolase)
MGYLTQNFDEQWAELENTVTRIANEHGFADVPIDVPRALCLIHSEVSEALEAYRKGNPPDDHIPNFSGLEAEMADIVIRIMHFAKTHQLNVPAAIEAKIRYNKSRPYKHGKVT